MYIAGKWRDSYPVIWPPILRPKIICIHEAIGFFFFAPLQPLRDSVVCTRKTKKITKFPICAEKFPTFNECLFPRLKRSHPHVEAFVRTINSNTKCISKEGTVNVTTEKRFPQIFEIHSTKPPDYLELFLKASIEIQFFYCCSILFMLKGEREESPAESLKRHFEYISLRRDMEKEVKCEKAF